MKICLLFLMYISTLNSSDPLINGVWIANVGKGCNDSLKFQNNHRVRIYDCEAAVTIGGRYSFSKDTLVIVERDDSNSEDGGKISYFKMKYIIQKKYLYPINSSQLTNGKWVDLKVKFPKNFVYKKIHS
jgi:hypothetical protein